MVTACFFFFEGLFNLMIKVVMFTAVLVFYGLFILLVSSFSASGFVYKLYSMFLCLQGHTVSWRFLQSDQIQTCFIIAKGKISKVDYSPFSFSLKILGVFEIIALGNTYVFKYSWI